MLKTLSTFIALLLMNHVVFAQDANDAGREENAPVESAQDDETEAPRETVESTGDGIESPKAMSGMSILGNEEAPKSLVIIPWKSSELGDTLSLSDSLDDRARPVDKEVFLRELDFYDIRASEQ